MRLRHIVVILALICVLFVLTTEAKGKGKWKKKKFQKMMAKKAGKGKGHHHNDIGDMNKKQMKKMMKRIKKMKMARMEKEGVEMGYNPNLMKKVSSKKHIAWLKLKSETECAMKCEQGEVCIVGPMDAKPLCVRKKDLKKSMKLFHKYQKKEKKAWKKFKMTHYNKDEEDDDVYFSKFAPKELGDTSSVDVKTDMVEAGHKKNVAENDNEVCTPAQFSQMRKRMMGWFHLLHGQDHLAMGKKVNLKSFHKSHSVRKEMRELNGTKCECAKSAMWQFHKVDKVADDSLTHDELSMMYQNDAEPCMKPFFTSCDLNGDEKLSADEWCCCFSNIVAPCFSRRSEKRTEDLAIQYTPRCDKEGYYKAEQCMVEKQGKYKCWCVDYNGNEYKDSVREGRPHCKKLEHHGYEKKPEV